MYSGMLLAALAARAAAAVPGMLLLALAARSAAAVPVTNATVPLWTSNSSCEYVQLRASFPLATPPRSITVYATAQATEKLLGAYKLWVNGVALAEGPGRALSSETQLVDVVDVDPSNADALALAVQGYKQKGGGRILVTTKIVHADGTVEIFGSDATWKANCLDGAARQECCLGGNYHAPRENWALDAFPAGWTGATFDDASWEPAAAQKAFAPLEAKASRPVGRFDDWHRAVAITEVKETVCAAAPQNERLYLTCNGTSTIEAVVFADFGAPSGACAAPRGAAAAGMIPTQNANASGSPANSFKTDATCTSTDAQSKIEALCVGRTSCDLGSDSRTFGSPSNACPASKWAAVAVRCAAAPPSYRYVVDLGAELQGGVLLRVPAHDRRAAEIIVRLGEARLPNGSVEFHMTTGNDYEERWAPYEDGSESVFDMGHEYREFRWAEVANSLAESIRASCVQLEAVPPLLARAERLEDDAAELREAAEAKLEAADAAGLAADAALERARAPVAALEQRGRVLDAARETLGDPERRARYDAPCRPSRDAPGCCARALPSGVELECAAPAAG